MKAPSPQTGLVLPGYQQENDLIFVMFPAGQYLIDEKPFMFTSYSGEKVIVDADKLDKIFKISTSNYIDHYVNQDTKEKLTVTEHTMKQLALLEKRKQLNDGFDDDIEYVWESIADRHAYELFQVLYRQVVFSEERYLPVKVIVEGHAPKIHPHIHPIRKVSGDLTNTLYQYHRNGHAACVVREMLLKNGWREVQEKIGVGGRPKDNDRVFYFGDGMEGAKLFTKEKDSYLTIEIRGLKEYEKANTWARTGTFEELEALYKVTDKDVRSMVAAFINKDKALQDLPSVTVGAILNNLISVRDKIREVDSVKKTQSAHISARKQLDMIIKAFMEAIE